MDKIILLKYGEIILKGLNRPRFEAVLLRNIKNMVPNYDLKLWIAQATVYCEPLNDDADIDELAIKLSKVFGVVSVAIASKIEKDLNKICEYAGNLLKDERNKTFKVETKRADKRFPYKSPEISCEVGASILDANETLTVDVHNPDILVMVEIRDFDAFCYTSKIEGVGGMPIGTNGRATLMLSGGIDSPVAGYMIAKRGVQLNAVHFYSYPYTSERAKQKVLDLAKLLTEYCGKIIVNVVPFTEIQLAINDNCPPEQMTIIMRRIMMYITNRIVDKTHANAIVTGESIGQVASQTIKSLQVTDDAAKYPVFRPLIGMDKSEIIDIARKIGTFETSILPYEDCCTVFTPKHPNTKPRLECILESEKLFNVEEMVERAIEGVEKIVIERD